MARSLRFLIVAVAGMAALLLAHVSTAAPAKPVGKPVTKTTSKVPRSTVKQTRSRQPSYKGHIRGHHVKGQFKGQLQSRKSGQTAYVVQARQRGSFKSGLMTPEAAVVARTRLRSQGFSAHLHNYGIQGSLVHYSMSQWRQHSIYANGEVANQVANLLRAQGLHARVVRR